MSGTSVHFDLMTAIKADLVAANFAWLSATGVVIQEAWAYQKDVQHLPFISISPFGQEGSEDWTCAEDETIYPTLIAIVGRTADDTLENRLGWREQLLRRFRNRSFIDVPSNFNNIPQPMNIIDREQFKAGMFISGILVKSYCTTTRLI